MEVFKTEVLKREFKKLVENVLLLLNECGNCGVFCCEYCNCLIVLFAKKLDVKAAALLRDLKNCY